MFHHLVCQTLDFSDKNICLYKLESPNSGSFKVWVLIIFFALSELPQWNESLNERLPHILFIVQIVIYWIRHLLHFVPAIVSISKQLWIYHHWGFHSFCQQFRTLRLLYILMGGNILSILVHLHFSATSNLFSISQCDWNNTAIINFKVHRFSW